MPVPAASLHGAVAVRVDGVVTRSIARPMEAGE